jgi:hypothetical protein
MAKRILGAGLASCRHPIINVNRKGQIRKIRRTFMGYFFSKISPILQSAK